MTVNINKDRELALMEIGHAVVKLFNDISDLEHRGAKSYSEYAYTNLTEMLFKDLVFYSNPDQYQGFDQFIEFIKSHNSNGSNPRMVELNNIIKEYIHSMSSISDAPLDYTLIKIEELHFSTSLIILISDFGVEINFNECHDVTKVLNFIDFIIDVFDIEVGNINPIISNAKKLYPDSDEQHIIIQSKLSLLIDHVCSNDSHDENMIMTRMLYHFSEHILNKGEDTHSTSHSFGCN